MNRVFVLGLLLVIAIGAYAQNNGSKGGYPVINSKKNKEKTQKWEKGWTPEHWGRKSNVDDCSDFGKTSYDRELFLTANVAYGIKPATSFGLTFGMMRRVGWFISLMSGTKFHTFNNNGSFDRDGQSDEMPFLLGDDYKSNTRLSAIVGGLVRLGKPVALRLGVGYGINELYYQGPDNTWFMDKKYSARGLDVSFGLQCIIGKIVVSGDAVATNFDMFEGKFGIGIIF